MAAELAELRPWAAPAAATLGGLAVGLLLRRFALPALARAAAKTRWRYDDILIQSVRGPIVLWCLLLGLRLGIRLLGVTNRTEALLSTIALVLGIVSVSWAAARFAAGVTRSFASAGALPGVSLLGNITAVLVMAIGILIVLQTLGIAITPMITALGVGGLAVGLALQDTLANLFAGIRVLAAGRIRHGDFVKLDSGEEGWVEDIAWGTTTIRQGLGNLVIVPNAKLAQAVTINYDLPAPAQVLLVNLGVAYGSDLDKVERVTLEEAGAALAASDAGVGDFTPVVRFLAFGDSSINLMVVLKARSYPERILLQHEFLKRIAARYAAEQIQIPFPTRHVIMDATTGPPPDGSPASGR